MKRFRSAPFLALLVFATIAVISLAAAGRKYVGEHRLASVKDRVAARENVAADISSYHNLTKIFKHTVNRLRYSSDHLFRLAASKERGEISKLSPRRVKLSTLTVVNSAGLVQALKMASSGDTVLLAPGTYSDVNLYKIDAGGVTIASADAGAKAVITDLNVNSSSGLTFNNIEFANVNNTSNVFKVSGSSDIHFNGAFVHGSLDGNSDNDQPAFQIRSSSNVSVENSEFAQVQIAITHLDDNGLKISGNYFHDVRMDGVRGGGSSNVEISNNYFTDFYRYGSEHPDAIQFWTTNTNSSAQNIVVSGNIFVRGNGGAVQGIFMGNEKNIPYENVQVVGNVIIGAMYHGIAVGTSNNVNVSGNYVQGYSDYNSWINVNHSTNAVVSGNEATRLKFESNENFSESNNHTLSAATDSISAVKAWLVEHPEAMHLLNGEALESLGLQAAPGGDVGYVVPPVAHDVAAVAVAAPVAGDVVTAGATSDQIVLSKGNDTVHGGVGDDTIQGVSGSNYLRGDDGNDVIHGGTGFDDINGNVGNDTAYGGAGDDWVVGGKGDDIVAGEDGNDIVYGNLGSDTVDGGAGDDVVRGGQDNDWIDGGAGNDWLSGDRGDDTLIGGAGADVFHTFADAGMDRVLDFHSAEGDRVMVDAGTQYSVAQTGADVTISMVGGGHMVLVDVQLSTLSDGWIFSA